MTVPIDALGRTDALEARRSQPERLVFVVSRSRLFSDALAHTISAIRGFHAVSVSADRAPPTDSQPDAVLAQSDRRRDRGYELVELAKTRWPTAPVIGILHMSIVPPTSPGSVEVDHWISAEADVSELALVLERATTPGPRRVSLPTPSRRNRTTRLARPHGLTLREVQMVRLLALGQSVPEISERLSISHHTVRKHAQNAMYKLGSHTRLELVATARQLGLLGGMRASDR
jgi:DNA-binding NarL/FixJ family response regulator